MTAKTQASAPDREPVRRASDIEEPSNRYLIHPISTALVPLFARLGISPNAVSFLGMACGSAAAFFYARHAQGWSMSMIGLLLMLAWHVCDGADGQLARLTGKQSEFGKVIDGICDYVVFISIYVAIALVSAPVHGPWVWALMLAAGAAHAVQAGAYEMQRQLFDYWALGKKSAALPDPEAQTAPGLAATLAGIYGRMQWQGSGLSPAFHARLRMIEREQPDAMPALRDAWRSSFAPLVHRWSILCANYRSFAIFIACILGQPLLYFIWELLLVPVHLLLARLQAGWNRQFEAAHLN
jgi:CDP-diacylglycerol---serine O-phosphatidyltransferase